MCNNNDKIITTVIGSFPKPNYLKIPDWFGDGTTIMTTTFDITKHNTFLDKQSSKTNDNIKRATQELISIYEEIGIDIISEEIKRENYINYHLRNISGISFEKLTNISSRNNAYTHYAPTIISKISLEDPKLYKDFLDIKKLLIK
jgi:5-methyltetrahydropteroyltriglutamate--homocysteine methyltransferase